MGGQGVLVQGRGMQTPVHIPPVPAKVRDVTGAGDAFCGGFAARLAECSDLVEAARAGAVAASFAIEEYGSLGLLQITAEERDQRMAALRHSTG